MLDLFLERLPELLQRIGPGLLAARDGVELVLHGGGEAVVEVTAEVGAQEVVDDLADVGRDETPAVHVDILAVLERRDDGGVGGGAADAVLLEGLDQRGFREARRRFGEMLRAAQPHELHGVALGERRQDAVVVVLGGVVDALEVDGDEARRHQRGAVRAQQVAARTVGAGEQVDGDGVEHGVGHLAGDRTLPDERVETKQVVVDATFQHLRQHGGRGRADRLVGFLRVARLVLVEAGALRHGLGAVEARDDLADLADRLVGEVHGVGAHVGDEADRAFAVVDAFVELLREAHGALRAEVELARGLLLQRGGGERRRRVAVALLAVD